MTDCPDGDIRDLLPDLVHGHLGAEQRSLVEEHAQACAECRAELALLRDLRGTWESGPAPDVTRIVGALPAYRIPVRRTWVGWRAAAAITLVVAGGASLLLTREEGAGAADSLAVGRASVASSNISGVDSTVPATAVAPTGVVRADAVPARERTTPAVVEGGELAMADESLGDLSDQELVSLLKELESLDALPLVEVEAVISPVPVRRTP